MKYVVVLETYENGDFARITEEFDTIEDAEEFVNDNHDEIDNVTRKGSIVICVYEVARTLYPHPVKIVESYELRDTPPPK